MRTGECFEFGWETFKRHAGALVFTSLMLVLAHVLLNGLCGALFRGFGALVPLLASGLFLGGHMMIARKAALGETPTLRDAFWPFTERQGDFILVGLADAAGLIACCVGVLATALLFMFAPLAVIEGGDYRQSLVRSKDLILRDLGQSITFFVIVIAVNLLGLLAFGIGLLISLPVTSLAIVKAYEQAAAAAAAPPVLPDAV
jgi:uncharacterized membrane protein